jgi:hypothetical protein
MTKDAPKEIFLKDYKKPDYAFEKVCHKWTLSLLQHVHIIALLIFITFFCVVVYIPFY